MGKGSKGSHPGHRVTLSIQRPSDMLQKLEWEAEALQRYWDEHDHHGPAYCAINGAITAWQLGDWVAWTLQDVKRWDLASAYFGRPVDGKIDLQREMRTCEALVVCQQIAAGAKHRNIDSGTYRPGYQALEFFDFFLAEPPVGSEGPQKIITVRSLEVSYPATQESGRPLNRMKSVKLMLHEAHTWWSAALAGMKMQVGDPVLRPLEAASK